jgi:hypothetical protein
MRITVTNARREAAAWAALRAERNARLAASDWTQVADAPVDAAAWAAYRQALRDMPENTADPTRACVARSTGVTA